MKANQSPRRRTQQLAAFCLAGMLSVCAQAAPGANFEGIWKITAQRTNLKPDSGEMPFTAMGKQAYEENKRNQAADKFEEYDYMKARCASPGMPRVMLTPQRIEIFQRPDLIMMAFEWNRLYRTITLPGLPTQAVDIGGAAASLVGTVMGTSKGHWENDTLVVITDMFSEVTLLDDLLPHGYDLKVTERIRLKNANTLEDRITIEDPEYFTRPWQTTLTYARQPDAVIPEDVCLDRLIGPPPLAK